VPSKPSSLNASKMSPPCLCSSRSGTIANIRSFNLEAWVRPIIFAPSCLSRAYEWGLHLPLTGNL
jgi:hypothetical protein